MRIASGCAGGLERKLPQDSLGLPRRSGGVEHPRTQRFVSDRRGGKAPGRVLQIEHPVAVTRPIDDQAKLDIRAIGHRRERDVALRLRRDEHLGEAVVDDIGDLGRGQEGIDVGVVEAGSLARRAALDEAEVVLHQHGEVVEPLEADGAQEMREPVAARLELSVCEGFARSGHDDGGPIGTCDGMQTWVHALPPGREDQNLVAMRPVSVGPLKLASGIARCRGGPAGFGSPFARIRLDPASSPQ